MAISKNSVRLQITLNKDNPKEKLINEFLDGCLNPNSTVKEIIYNYIVSNFDLPLLTVTHSKSVQSEVKLLTVSESKLLSNNEVIQSYSKSVEVSNFDGKSLEVTELEMNELDELKKFI